MIVRRARIRGSLWRDYETACLAISVGRLNHEGANLVAALEMMEVIGKPVVIRLSDTLQRHNLIAYGMDTDNALSISRTIGSAWLNRYRALLERFSFSSTIIRWDDVLAHPDFEKIHRSFVKASQGQNVFSHTLGLDIDTFLSRRKFSSSEEKDNFAECSRKFLLEEIAGHTVLGRQYKYACFYPGKPLRILELARSNAFFELPRGLENTAFIKFTLETKHCEPDRTLPFLNTQDCGWALSKSA